MKNYGSLLILHFLFFVFFIFFFSLFFLFFLFIRVYVYVCFPYFPSRRRLPFALLYRFRFASSFLSLVPTNVDVPPYKSPEVERLACSNHHPRTGYVVARVRIRSIISNLSLHFSQLSRFTRSSKVPSPSQKKKKNDHITHMYTYISLAALLSPPFVRINEKLSYHRFPSHGGGEKKI